MAKKRILFIGNAAIRFAVGTPYIPAPGESILSDGNYTFAPGGRSALSAIAAAETSDELEALRGILQNAAKKQEK